VAPATVRTHVKHILGKLGVHSRDEAIRHVERLRRRRMNVFRSGPVE
jgi:DNA-binding CsgD family transcriptional regulator